MYKGNNSIVRFLALVSMMVTKVDHSNHWVTIVVTTMVVITTMVTTMEIHEFVIYCPEFCHIR